MIKKDKSVRITFFLISTIVIFGLIGFRLFDLAYVKNHVYREITERRRENPMIFSRGDIYMKSADGPVLTATTITLSPLR